jgi:hypothetical protein
MPHLFALNEKRIPMIVVWVCGEDPIVSSRSGYRHLEKKFGGTIHAMTCKAKQNMRVRRSKGCGEVKPIGLKPRITLFNSID